METRGGINGSVQWVCRAFVQIVTVQVPQRQSVYSVCGTRKRPAFHKKGWEFATSASWWQAKIQRKRKQGIEKANDRSRTSTSAHEFANLSSLSGCCTCRCLLIFRLMRRTLLEVLVGRHISLMILIILAFCHIGPDIIRCAKCKTATCNSIRAHLV